MTIVNNKIIKDVLKLTTKDVVFKKIDYACDGAFRRNPNYRSPAAFGFAPINHFFGLSFRDFMSDSMRESNEVSK